MKFVTQKTEYFLEEFRRSEQQWKDLGPEASQFMVRAQTARACGADVAISCATPLEVGGGIGGKRIMLSKKSRRPVKIQMSTWATLAEPFISSSQRLFCRRRTA
jgi:hypothetical protein